MAAEVAAAVDPEFRFLRLSQLGAAPLDGVGLLVVDPGVPHAPELGPPTLRLRLVPSPEGPAPDPGPA